MCKQRIEDLEQIFMGNMVGKQEIYDVIIVGAGTAGLSAAVYAARASKKVLVLEETS